MTVRSWLADNLRPASFRGVAFEVDSSDKTFGPRTVTHEFPLRDDVTHEFLGKLPRGFAIEALLIGEDLLDQVRRLEEALDDTSIGRLIHPWYGELDVVVIGEVHTKMSTGEGRVAHITAQFQLAGGPQSPIAKVDTAAAVDRAADKANAAVVADFAEAFTVKGVQDFVVEHGLGVIGAVAARTATIMRSFGLASQMASGYIGGTANDLATLDAGDLQDTTALGNQVAGLFEPSSTRVTPTLAVSNALLALGNQRGLGSVVAAPTGVTPSWKRAAVNQQSLITLAQVTAAIEGARAGTKAGWDSRDQAMKWRDQAADDLDQAADLAGNAAWDASWRAATDLRAALVKDVAIRAAPLPRLATLQPVATLPAALLAYQIDGDNLDTLFDRAEDLRRRNRVRHPGFVSGGRPLEVLIDA